MIDFMRIPCIVRWYLDPANQKESAEIAARVTKQPAELFRLALQERLSHPT